MLIFSMTVNSRPSQLYICISFYHILLGLKIQCIHAGKTKGQREHIIDEFRHGNVWILICTTVLSRGVDFPAVKLVVNYDLPQSPIEYIHSVGRTGRAGRTGKAVTFFTEDDRDNLRR